MHICMALGSSHRCIEIVTTFPTHPFAVPLDAALPPPASRLDPENPTSPKPQTALIIIIVTMLMIVTIILMIIVMIMCSFLHWRIGQELPLLERSIWRQVGAAQT